VPPDADAAPVAGASAPAAAGAPVRDGASPSSSRAAPVAGGASASAPASATSAPDAAGSAGTLATWPEAAAAAAANGTTSPAAGHGRLGSSAVPVVPAASAGPTAPAGTAVVRQPRDFGHVIGDVLTQRVLLQDGDRALRPLALPPADRVGPFLERRTPRVEIDEEGRRWLAIDYQFVNAPRALTTTQLPALAIATEPEAGADARRSGPGVARSGDARRNAAAPEGGEAARDAAGGPSAAIGPALAVPAWPVSIGPLSAASPSLDPADLRPDAPLRLPSTAALRRSLAASAGALAAVLAAWFGWWFWRERRESVRLPFARAERELRRLEPDSSAAWQCLHRALNASAGRVVPAAGLPGWLDERPDLKPLQPRLEAFYRRSSRRFFDPAVAAAGEGADFDLLGLCRALRRAERRHAR
jgi:mxaA protein